MNIFCYFLFIIACKCQLFVDQIHVESYNGFLRDTAANQSKATVKIAVIGILAFPTSYKFVPTLYNRRWCCRNFILPLS